MALNYGHSRIRSPVLHQFAAGLLGGSTKESTRAGMPMVPELRAAADRISGWRIED
jgi:hypothetical protein